MTTLAAALLLAVACFVLRVLPVAVLPADRLPTTMQESLHYLAPAVLASLVTVEMVDAVRATALLPSLLMVVGMALAALLVHRTGSLALTVGVGATVALVVDLLLLAP
jgi:branched-subunit amino acid transport protein